MDKVKINIKPISVNDCWQGKRYKTSTYTNFEHYVLLSLPPMELPEPPYKINFEFGFSSIKSDWDNPVKPIQDILSKKYGFNDNQIYEATVRKKVVKRGEEYFSFLIESLK